MGHGMINQDPKIICFEAVQAKQKEGSKLPVHRIAAELRTIQTKELTELFQQLFIVIDDELFKRSNWESAEQKAHYFETMRQVRVESASIQANFHARMARQLDEFFKKRPQALEDQGGLFGDLDESSFALVENEALEEEIAVKSMIEKGNNLFQGPLYGLNKRYAALIEKGEIQPEENPIAPRAVCHAFADALKPLNLSLSIKLLIFKLFDQSVLTGLGKLYHELNTYLVNSGVLPTLSRGVAKRPPPVIGAFPPGIFPNVADGEGADENQQAYVKVFQGMQRLLDGWRAQMGFHLRQGEGYPAAGPAVDTGEVLNALSLLQAPAMAMGEQPAAEGLKSFITDQLLKARPGEARPLARPDEDIIDMVALIFDFILEDRNLPDPVKGLIARLQIPVVKVAMIEKSFFGRKNHPVRLLLNALAQAGVGLDSTEGVTGTPVFKKIDSIVGRVLDEFDQNVGLFSDLLDEFMGFLEKEGQRSRIAEERTRQVTQSKEQLHLAKRKIAYEIASRLQGKTTPAAVRSFLYNTWKDVLVLAYLRRDKQAGDWEVALEVMDRLIWSVIPPEDANARKAIIHAIPRLLKAIRAGLESISLDPQAVASAIKELEASHVACLSPQGAESGQGKADKPGPAEEPAVEIRDPELAQAIVDIRSNLPDIENLTVQDLCRSPEEIGAAGYGVDLVVEDEYIFKARELEVGAWVEFDDGEHKRLRGKLSWKSQVTSTYVFVNRKGAKVLEIPLGDLARKMSLGHARVIEDAGTPLMDRAFGALLSKLKGPAPKPS
jgi:hypothetical protein